MNNVQTYNCVFEIGSREARPFIRSIFKLFQRYADTFDLRLAPKNRGYRIYKGNSHCDITNAFVAKEERITISAKFASGSSNDALLGRVMGMLGMLVCYGRHTKNGTLYDANKSNLVDIETLTRWGEYSLNEIYKKFPDDFPELENLPAVQDAKPKKKKRNKPVRAQKIQF